MPTTTLPRPPKTRPGMCEECGDETGLTFASGYLMCRPCEVAQTPARVLHLGIVALDRRYPDPVPRAFGCYITEERLVRLTPGTDSFVRWANTEDPREDHTEDGTRHIVLNFAEADVPDSHTTEREWAEALHAHLTTYLLAHGRGWRAADYAVWTDDVHSENAHTVVCL